MVLANRTRVQNSRTLLRAFGGLNEGYGCSEAEYSAGINFSSRDFPALSTRKPRRKLRTLTGLNGMYHLNGLLTVCGKDLVYTPDDGGETVTCTDAVADSKKALVGLGTKILIFPDKVAFDTADGSVSALGACWKAEGQSVEFAPCDAEGRTYTPTGVGREEPESPADGQIFLKVEDEEHPWRYDGTLEVYSAASGNWTALPLDYCRITAAGAQEKFCQWDTVTVQGTAAKQAGQWEALDGDCVVYAVTENSLCVRADPAGDYFYGTLVQGTDAAQWTSLDGSQTRSIAAEQTVQLERRVPDLDFVTECDNRVWGCSSRENVIYACKLGDPTNWFSYCGGQLCGDGGQRRSLYRRGYLHGLCVVLQGEHPAQAVRHKALGFSAHLPALPGRGQECGPQPVRAERDAVLPLAGWGHGMGRQHPHQGVGGVGRQPAG